MYVLKRYVWYGMVWFFFPDSSGFELLLERSDKSTSTELLLRARVSMTENGGHLRSGRWLCDLF
jgi:hypothetical protein